jgi:hypothetical protein
MQVLEPIWKPTLISSTYQSIKGRGIHKALKDIKRDLKKYNPIYYLQIYIQKFNPSISAREDKKEVMRKITNDTLVFERKTKSILFRISTKIIIIYLIQKFPFCIL